MRSPARSPPVPTAHGWPRSSSRSSDSSTAAPALRRAAADTSREGADKAQLAEQLFAGKVSAETLVVVKGVFAQRWTSSVTSPTRSRRMPSMAVIAQAEAEGRADQVEDELFRFERIVAADPGLRAALTDTQASADRRAALVESLLADKVAPETLGLVRQAVRRPARSPVRPGASRATSTRPRSRREQQTATVTSAVPLTDEDRAPARRAASPPSTAARSTSTSSSTPGHRRDQGRDR